MLDEGVTRVALLADWTREAFVVLHIFCMQSTQQWWMHGSCDRFDGKSHVSGHTAHSKVFVTPVRRGASRKPPSRCLSGLRRQDDAPGRNRR